MPLVMHGVIYLRENQWDLNETCAWPTMTEWFVGGRLINMTTPSCETLADKGTHHIDESLQDRFKDRQDVDG